MRVLGIRSRPELTSADATVEVVGPENLANVLAVADYVVLSVPETSVTRDMIGAAELSVMRPDAVLMNLSRGGILDEGALAESLRAGRIRGAALDVFREEPLPAHSPLWDLDNVLITPHAGSISPRFWQRETDLMVRNVGHYLCGEDLENLVHKRRGY
jgi:phosphoglycerate dehydrogenase-like enzyme